MRIHVTGLRGIPGVMGGIESHCEELLPRIKARNADLDITVLCRAPYVDGERRVHRGIALAPLPSPRSKSLEAIVAAFIPILYAWIRGAQIIHIHAIGPAWLCPLARITGLQDRKRVVEGKSGSGRVELGGRRILKTQKTT